MSSILARLLYDFFGDIELGDGAALACKLVTMALSLGLLTVVVALEHLIAEFNVSTLKRFYFAC